MSNLVTDYYEVAVIATYVNTGSTYCIGKIETSVELDHSMYKGSGPILQHVQIIN